MKPESTMSEGLRRAIERGERIQAQVRDVTLAALARNELDRERMRKVTREAIESVRDAAALQGALAKDAMREGLAGIDEALAHAAQALKLSLEEAAGRAQKFSREDLAKAREDLRDLEKLFLDSLRDTAEASRGAAAEILGDLRKHAEASGTAVGRQLKDVAAFSAHLREAGREQFAAGMRAAAASGAMMARVASGVLGGIAGNLEKKAGNPRANSGTKPGR